MKSQLIPHKAHFIEPAVPGGRRSSSRSIWFVLLICTLVLASCGSDTDAAQDVVKRMYEALNNGDANAYMDTLAPSTRNQPDIGGVLWQLGSGLSLSAGAGGISANLPLGDLLMPKVQGVSYNAAKQEDGHVVVQARGKIRAMMGEFAFCDTFDIVKEDGKWYIDRFHPARQPRLERLAERNLRIAEEQTGTSPVSDDPFAGLGQVLQASGAAMEIALNLCE